MQDDSPAGSSWNSMLTRSKNTTFGVPWTLQEDCAKGSCNSMLGKSILIHHHFANLCCKSRKFVQQSMAQENVIVLCQLRHSINSKWLQEPSLDHICYEEAAFVPNSNSIPACKQSTGVRV